MGLVWLGPDPSFSINIHVLLLRSPGWLWNLILKESHVNIWRSYKIGIQCFIFLRGWSSSHDFYLKNLCIKLTVWLQLCLVGYSRLKTDKISTLLSVYGHNKIYSLSPWWQWIIEECSSESAFCLMMIWPHTGLGLVVSPQNSNLLAHLFAGSPWRERQLSSTGCRLIIVLHILHACLYVFLFGYVTLIVKVCCINSRAMCFPGVHLLPITFTRDLMSSPHLPAPF